MLFNPGQILGDAQDSRNKWETTLLDSMHKVGNLTSTLDGLEVETEATRSDFDYRKDSFNETHSAFVVEAKLLDEEIQNLRKALARAEQKVMDVNTHTHLSRALSSPPSPPIAVLTVFSVCFVNTDPDLIHYS